MNEEPFAGKQPSSTTTQPKGTPNACENSASRLDVGPDHANQKVVVPTPVALDDLFPALSPSEDNPLLVYSEEEEVEEHQDGSGIRRRTRRKRSLGARQIGPLTATALAIALASIACIVFLISRG